MKCFTKLDDLEQFGHFLAIWSNWPSSGDARSRFCFKCQELIAIAQIAFAVKKNIAVRIVTPACMYLGSNVKILEIVTFVQISQDGAHNMAHDV